MNPTEADFIKVKVVDYDPDWPKLFKKKALLIKDVLKDDLLNIFHIGSTSVPGLKAKPVIDIMPVVKEIGRLDGMALQFASIGYEGLGELGITGRRYFRKGGQNRTHQIHAFQYDNLRSIVRHIAFRDYLEAFRDISQEYAALKTALALKYPDDIGAYCDGKDAFIKKHERLAVQWYREAYSCRQCKLCLLFCKSRF